MGRIIVDPSTGQLVDSDTGAPVGPATTPGQGYDPTVAAPLAPQQPQGPVTTPDQVIPQQDVSRVSVSQRGYDPATADVIEGRATGLQGELNAAANQAQSDAATETANVTAAAQDEADANERLNSIEANRLGAQEDAFNARAALESDIIRAEALANEHSQAAADGSLANYTQAVQAYGAMQVDPTLNFSKGESIGNAASLFAQGFLGAAGIKVDAQRALDGWTDRYVENQMEKIRRGEKLSDAAKVEWDMVRAESADQADARARYRVLLLSQADTAMQAEGAKYGSMLALAQSDAMRAKIRGSLANALMEIHRNARDVAFRDMQAIKQNFIAKQQLAISSRSVALQERAEKRELDAAKAAQDLAANQFQVFQFDTGEVTGFVRDEYKDDKVAVRKVAEVQGVTQEALEALRGLQRIAQTHGGIPTTSNHWALQKTIGDDTAEVLALRARLFGAMRGIRGTGAALTGNEEKLINDEVAMNTWINGISSDGSAKVLDQTALGILGKAEGVIRPFVRNPDDNGQTIWRGSLAPTERAQSNIGIQGVTPELSPVQKAAGRVRVPGGHDDTALPQTDFGTAIGAAQPPSKGVGGRRYDEAGNEYGSEPEWVKDMASVARALLPRTDINPLTGETADVGGADEAERRTALKLLSEMTGDESQPVRRRAAQYILNQYQHNPEQLRAELDKSGY